MEDKLRNAKKYIENQLDQESFSRMKRVITHRKERKFKKYAIRYSLSFLFIISSSTLIFLIVSNSINQNPPSDRLDITESEEEEKDKLISHTFASQAEVTKEDIVDRMMNTGEYFETIVGTYVFEAKDQNIREVYEIKLDLRNKQTNGYIKSETDNAVQEHFIPLGSNMDKNNNLELAGTAIKPSNIAQVLKSEIDHWNIIKKEEFSKLQTVVIEGNISEYDNNKFKVWIHTGTGIILRLEETNEKGELVSSYNFEKIAFNTEFKELSIVQTVQDLNEISYFGQLSDYHITALPNGTKRVEVKSLKEQSSSIIFIRDGEEKIFFKVFSKGIIEQEEYINGETIDLANGETGFFIDGRNPAIMWENSQSGKLYSIYIEKSKITGDDVKTQLTEIINEIINK